MKNDKLKIKKDDKVKVITGKDKGKIGRVLKVQKKSNRLIIENINMVKSHQKPNMQNKQGGIVDKESPIHISNVMVMCGNCVSPVRIKIQELEDGKKVRICRKCQEQIDAWVSYRRTDV